MYTIKVTDQFKTQDNDGNEIVRIKCSIKKGDAEVQSLSFDHPIAKSVDDIVEDLKKTLINYELESESRIQEEQVVNTLERLDGLEIATEKTEKQYEKND